MRRNKFDKKGKKKNHIHTDSKSGDNVIPPHLAISCTTPLVLSFSMFGGGAAFSAVTALLSTSCPTGQRCGGLADCPFPTRMLCLGRPLQS